MTSWKKLSQKVLLQHPRLTVYEDQVELPNGHKTAYIHFGTGNSSTTILAINEDGKILLQKEYSYPPNEWLYQFPGGATEAGETQEQGALRELQEEVGYSGDLKLLGAYYIDNRRRGDKVYNYTARNLKPSQIENDIEEEFESYWHTEQEIDELIATGKIINFSCLSTWALYKAHLACGAKR